MKLCPICGKIADYNSYFGAYICNNCSWKDDTPNRKRLAMYHSLSDSSNSKESSNNKKRLVTV
mgnify:CR=1 FL=1